MNFLFVIQNICKQYNLENKQGEECRGYSAMKCFQYLYSNSVQMSKQVLAVKGGEWEALGAEVLFIPLPYQFSSVSTNTAEGWDNGSAHSCVLNTDMAAARAA